MKFAASTWKSWAIGGLSIASLFMLNAVRAESFYTTAYAEAGTSQPEFLPIALATAVPMSHADRHFMEKALQVARDEMRLSRLAVDRATNDHVREFANQVFTAQTQAEKTLTVMAASKGLTLRNDVRSDRYFSALNEKEGPDFDLYFVAHLIDVEEDTITLFEKSAQSDDPDIAAFATRTLNLLEEHMRQAKEIERDLRGNR